jgi:cyclophilin family peptidyl-prolyl cis-trans isomerase
MSLWTKRTAFLLGVLILALGLAACGSSGSQPATAEPAAATEAPAATSAPEAAGTPEAPAAASAESPAGEDTASRNNMYSEPPAMTIDPSKYYYATFKTEKGDIVVQLFADRVPETVNNFVFLAREGFYDNTTFHRVLEGFMAQGGDPTGTGSGGPGYTFADEFVEGLVFDRPGLLAMANAGPNTNGSQFFITFAPTEWLNYRHTIFGEVVEGMDVLSQLTLRDPQQNPDFEGDKILSIEIEERDDSILPTPLPPTPTPTPFAPTDISGEDVVGGDRPLAELPMEERSNYFNAAPAMVIDTSRQYTATISTTQGDLVVQLYDDQAPVAVNNFVVLASLGFYDGTPINDTSGGQAIIFGAPENVPQSYVGYSFPGEVGTDITVAAGSLAYLPFQDPFAGTLASNGSQILIATIAPPQEATFQLSFFGQIVEGLDLLQSLTTEDAINTITITME